jgi:hypothetical protein
MKRSRYASPSGRPCDSLAQLDHLRDFVRDTATGSSPWSEQELCDCLRQCSYNVDRAAEALMTGAYRPSSVGWKARVKTEPSAQHTTTAECIDLTTASPAAPVRTSLASLVPTSAKNPIVLDLSSDSYDTASLSTETVSDAACARSASPWDPPIDSPPSSPIRKPQSSNSLAYMPMDSSPSSPVRKSSSSPHPFGYIPMDSPPPSPVRKIPSVTQATPTSQLPHDSFLLCHRWMSDAVCTTKHGRVRYKEPLTITASHPRVRFEGTHLQGTLPADVSSFCNPLLRAGLIAVQGESLMDVPHMRLGSELPVAVRVILLQPCEFFAACGAVDTTTSNHALYFTDRAVANPKQVGLGPAAFALLQWAQYGNLPEFAVPGGGETVIKTEPVDEEVREDFFEDDDTHEQRADWVDQVEELQHWAVTLPQAADPPGLAEGVTLRPYQKQALHWMRQRETTETSRAELEEQLALLSELASTQQKLPLVAMTPLPPKVDIVCERGPVVLSDQAQREVQTWAGLANPAVHPLWQRRYVASPDLSECRVFYVNELVGKATLEPPKPPRPCAGGILADAMGLGKTVRCSCLLCDLAPFCF